MCQYQIFHEGEMPISKHTKSFCTLCVLGNGKTYKEAEEAKKSEEGD